MNELLKKLKENAAELFGGVFPPEGALRYFAEFCDAKGLDPIAKEAYLIQSGGKWTAIVSIDALRKKAVATGRYLGGRAKYLVEGENAFRDVVDPGVHKVAAVRWEVFIKDSPYPAARDAFAREYKNRGGAWTNHPVHMLTKIAEAHALRSFFPETTGGLYTREEIEGWRNETPPRPAPPSAPPPPSKNDYPALFESEFDDFCLPRFFPLKDFLLENYGKKAAEILIEKFSDKFDPESFEIFAAVFDVFVRRGGAGEPGLRERFLAFVKDVETAAIKKHYERVYPNDDYDFPEDYNVADAILGSTLSGEIRVDANISVESMAQKVKRQKPFGKYLFCTKIPKYAPENVILPPSLF